MAWIHDEGVIGDRLLEMGLTPGAPVVVIRRYSRALPMQLRVRGFLLSLRDTEAMQVEVARR